MCASCVLELNTTDTDIIIGTHVVDGTDRLRSVIPPGSSQEGDLHESSKRVLARY